MNDHAPSAVRATDLTLGYAGEPVVENVDLDVTPGEILVVLGHSGCGKSTLLRAIAGLITPLHGEVVADGRRVTGPDADRALVFQDDALLPWRSARRNVELPLAVQGVGRRERRRRAEEWLARVGLSRFSERLPGQLSGGMRQRVQLARALAGEPGVICMDEPFGALDAQTRASMQRLLIEAWTTSGCTVVFVTHDVDEALVLGDRIVVLGRYGVVSEHPVEHPRDPEQPPRSAVPGPGSGGAVQHPVAGPDRREAGGRMSTTTTLQAPPVTERRELECDVLVIGGGTAGTMAAITAAEAGSDVLLMEKAHVRHSGALAMGMDGVNNAVIPGKATPEDYVAEITRANDGIVNQRDRAPDRDPRLRDGAAPREVRREVREGRVRRLQRPPRAPIG